MQPLNVCTEAPEEDEEAIPLLAGPLVLPRALPIWPPRQAVNELASRPHQERARRSLPFHVIFVVDASSSIRAVRSLISEGMPMVFARACRSRNHPSMPYLVCIVQRHCGILWPSLFELLHLCAWVKCC